MDKTRLLIRENLSNCRAGSGDVAITEGIRDEGVGSVAVKPLFFNDMVELFGFFLFNKFLPIFINYGVNIERSDELIDKVFLISKLNTGINGLVNIN